MGHATGCEINAWVLCSELPGLFLRQYLGCEVDPKRVPRPVHYLLFRALAPV